MTRPPLDPPVPVRFCLDCRTALGPGDPCEAWRSHRVVDLGSRAGLERIVHEVWGPDARPMWTDRVRGLGTSVGVIGATGTAALAYAAHGLAAAVLAFGGMALVALASGAANEEGAAPLASARMVPMPASLPTQGVERGTVEGSTFVRAPGSGRRCLAYALALGDLDDAVSYYEAHSAGFEVRTANGARFEVPEGRIRLAGRSIRVRELSGAHARRLGIPEHLRAGGVVWPVFPFERAREVIVRPGDRVAFGGAVSSQTEVVSGDYRTSPAARRSALRGLPRLVLEKSRKRS